MSSRGRNVPILLAAAHQVFPFRYQRSVTWPVLESMTVTIECNTSRRYFVFCRVIVSFDCGVNRSTISLLALGPSEVGGSAAECFSSWAVEFQMSTVALWKTPVVRV